MPELSRCPSTRTAYRSRWSRAGVSEAARSWMRRAVLDRAAVKAKAAGIACGTVHAIDRRAVGGDPRRRQEGEGGHDRHGLAWPPRHCRPAARQRDDQGADAQHAARCSSFASGSLGHHRYPVGLSGHGPRPHSARKAATFAAASNRNSTHASDCAPPECGRARAFVCRGREQQHDADNTRPARHSRRTPTCRSGIPGVPSRSVRCSV